MTLIEVLLIVFVVLMALMFPKLGKRGPKKRKPLPRKGPFRVHDNPLKQYREPSPDFKAVAYQRAREQYLNPTAPELAFASLLRDMGFVEHPNYELQYVMFYPGGYAIFDCFFPRNKLVCEVDGATHDEPGQHNHDIGRDEYFARQGIRTVRLRNKLVMSSPHIVRALILAELGILA